MRGNLYTFIFGASPHPQSQRPHRECSAQVDSDIGATLAVEEEHRSQLTFEAIRPGKRNDETWTKHGSYGYGYGSKPWYSGRLSSGLAQKIWLGIWFLQVETPGEAAMGPNFAPRHQVFSRCNGVPMRKQCSEANDDRGSLCHVLKNSFSQLFLLKKFGRKVSMT